MSKVIFDFMPDFSINESELVKIVGGKFLDKQSVVLNDGCVSGICSVKINPEYCAGAAVCTSGIAG